MAEFAGQLEVKVTPDTSSFRRDLETGATAAAARAAERIGREMGKIIAQQISKGITDGLATIRTGTAGAAAGRQFGRSFAKTANAEIKSGIKSATVKVHADTKAARTEIDAFAKAAGERLAEQVADGLRDGATEGSKDIPKQAPKAGAEYGGEFARSLKARLSEALKNLPDVEINADSSDADIKIREIRGQLESLRDKRIGVDITAADALTRIRAIQAQLGDLERNSPDIQVRVDAAAATARLQAFAAQAERLERDGVDVDVDVDTGGAIASLAALRGAAGGASSGMLGIVTAAVALGPALVPIGAAGTAALAAVGTAAVGAAGGVGVLVLALKPVIEVMQLLGKAQSSVGASAGQAAGQHLQMAAASDALKAAQDGLASAIQNAREQEERSAERVADARRNLARAKEDAARDEAEAARRVADAEQDLADAQRDFVDAQLAINDARKEAAEQLEDLESRLANAYLDREAAQLRMEEAAARLNEVEQDATSTSIERRQAQLDLNRAQQALTDSQRDLLRLQEESDEANRKGIDGSDAVTRAREREKDAADRLGDAQQGVADAQEDAERRRRESDERVADAQRALAQAVQDSAIQQRKSAEQVAAAQRQVISAQRGVERSAISAGSAGGAAMNDLRDAMAKLSPEGRRFVQFLRSEFLPAFSGLSKVAQRGLLPGLQEALGAVLSLAPLVTDLVASLSRAMGTLFREAGRALTGPFWTDFFRFIAQTAAPALLTLGRTIGNLITGFAGLFQAFSPVGLAVGDALLRLSERFAEFGRTARENPAFQSFLAYVREVGPLVAATIGSLVRAIGNILRALAPVGVVVLQVVKGIADFIASANPVVIQAIAVGFVAIGTALALLNANPIVLIGVAIAGLVAGIGWLYDNVEWFREYWDWAWANLVAVTKALWENVLQPVFRAVVAYVRDVLAPTIVWLWRNIFEPAWRGISTFVQAAWTSVIQPVLRAHVDFMRNVVAPTVLWLWHNIIQPAWQGISTIVQFAWTNIIQPVFRFLVAYIRDVLAPTMTWLWRNIVQPVWRGIEVAIDVAWAVIRLIFGAIRTYVREVLGPVFTWLRDYVIRPVWNGIASVISTVWNTAIRPVFVAVGDFIEDHVAPAFRRGVDAIRAAWDRVREAAAAPVRFIVNTVINRGIIGAYNRLANWFGVDPVNEVQLPEGFATGGLLRGPGTGTSDSILARVSAGEYIIPANVVKRLGVDFFDALRSTGNAAGDIKSVVGAPRFATGGLVQKVLSWLPSTDPLPYVWGGVGPNGYDCCIVAGVRVYGPDGATPIEDVRAGDRVYSYVDGRLEAHAVTNAWQSIHQPVFEVRTRNRSVTASANHPFLRMARVGEETVRHMDEAEWAGVLYGPNRGQCSVSTCDTNAWASGMCGTHYARYRKHGDPLVRWVSTRTKFEAQWARLDELERGDFLVLPRSVPTEPKPEATLSDGTPVDADVAWLIGAAVGDGTVTDKSLRLCLFGEKRDRAAGILRRWGCTPTYNESAGVIGSNVRLASALTDLGMKVRGPEKRIPDAVWLWPHDLQAAFLDGYCDADGYRPADQSRHGERTYSSASRELIEDVRALHITLGDSVSNISVAKRTKPIIIKGKTVKNALDQHTMTIWPGKRSGESCVRHDLPDLAEWLDAGEFTVSPVLSVTPKGEADTWDLTVEDAHNFIADGIVVHNSGLTGEAYNRLTGRPSFRRAFTTSSDMTSLGFRRGEGMFTLGLTPGEHVVGRLGALPFEAQSTATGIFVGSGATPVNRMAQQWFLPSVGPGGGDPPSGFDIRHPIASMKRIITAPLAKLSEIEGTPFGALAAHMPRAVADAAVGKLTGALDGLPGFARGGLVSYDSGGWLPQGLSTVVNASGSPEPVLTPGQWDALAGTGGGQTFVFETHYPAPETPSETASRSMRKLAAYGAVG